MIIQLWRNSENLYVRLPGKYRLMKTQYTLIAFDMDGTLLDPAKKILPQTREAVRRAAKAGKIVALCTGRALAEVSPYLDAGALEGVRYAVLCSGSLIYDLAAHRMIGHTVFTARETAEILEAVRGRNVQAQLLSGGRAVLSRRAFQHLKEYGMDQYSALYRDTAAVAEDTAEMLQRGEISCEKINLWHADCPGTGHTAVEERAVTEEKLDGTGLVLARAERSNLEINPPGTSKGAGLSSLCRMLRLPMEQVIAVGDAENDRTMFARAGLAVAMGNAAPEIRKLCGMTVADNAHGGCAEAVELLLGGRRGEFFPDQAGTDGAGTREMEEAAGPVCK